jgi:hypothetical protein
MLASIGIFIVIQTILVLVIAAAGLSGMVDLGLGPAPAFDDSAAVDQWASGLDGSGMVLGLVTLVGCPICISFLWLVCLLRGAPWREYMAWDRPSWKTLLRTAPVVVAFWIASDLVTLALGRPIVPPFMMQAYETAGFLPILLIAVIVIAPIFEETLFRGLAFRGWERSFLTPIGTIVLTSAIWAAMHIQYDWYGMGLVLATGFLLGGIRYFTKSTTVAILAHGLFNLVATIEVVIQVEMGG